MATTTQSPPAAVHVDGLALLKIIKHCHEALPTLASGELLGMHQPATDTLSISDCFVFPFRSEAEENEDEVSTDPTFEERMMELLKECQVENNVVGQFSATFLDCNVFSADLIQSQFDLQSERGAGQVCVMYDPLLTANGALTVKAYRLSDAFMGAYEGGDFSHAALAAAGFDTNAIMEEVPVRLENTPLITALMLELSEREDMVGSAFDRLDLSTHAFLERNIRFVTAAMDDLTQEHNKLQHFQKTVQRQRQEAHRWQHKRRLENEERRDQGLEPLADDGEGAAAALKPAVEPSRLEALLLSHQIDKYCEQINRSAGVGLGKLFLAGGMQSSA